MKDGSDAIADWPILNALLNAVAGATWVSVHHGGGVGMGYSIHAGMVVVADGTRRGRARASQRVLTTDPGTGVMRHADAGYERAIDVARERGVHLPDARPQRMTPPAGPPDLWTAAPRRAPGGADAAARPVLLTGPPGAGKTTLLLRVGGALARRGLGAASTST